MEENKTHKPRYLALLLIGIVIGSLITCLLASFAAERRDAIVISSFQGLEGVRSLQAEEAGHSLDAYTHQANVVAVMEQKKEALGLDLVPWSFWTPFSYTAQKLIVPTPTNNWAEREVQVQKNRLMKLSK